MTDSDRSEGVLPDCLCGCGNPVKNASSRFLHTHASKTRKGRDWKSPNPSGLCMCGCGQKTPIAKTQGGSNREYVKGCHLRYIPGHHANKHTLLEKDTRYRTAVCVRCGPVKLIRRGGQWACGSLKVKPKSPEKSREFRLKKYGITLLDYERMLVAQDNKCLICIKEHTWEKPLVVDHDHKTGAVVGLLCSNCNTGIGMLQEDPDVVAAALSYVREKLQQSVKTHPSIEAADSVAF